MSHPPTPPTRLLALAAALGLSLLAGTARADYLVASGDVLDITVFRVPELSREVRVDVDGKIALPPLGRVDVAGQTVDSIADLISGQLTKREILSGPQVTVALAAARPVFVGGDVATPGAFPYQSGLTVRRAIALAGGLGFARARGAEEASRLRGERDTTAIDLLRQRARLIRIDAEITDRDTFDGASLGRDRDMPQAAYDGVLSLEAGKLAADLAEAHEEKAHLQRAVDLVQDRIKTLTEQQELQQTLIQRQSDEIDRIRDIQSRGLASQARVTEEQRVLDSLLERSAANETEIAAARESLEGATYALARFDDRRKAALGTEKQDALLAIAAGEATLRAADQRLAELGASDLGTLRTLIYPAGQPGSAGVPADFGTELAPGDTLDITLVMEGGPAAPQAGPQAATGGQP